MYLRKTIDRWWDSDIAYDFRRSPLAVSAALIALIFGVGAFAAEWVAPYNPFDLSSIELLDASKPPAWLAGGEARFLLGTDHQGRDVLSATLFGMRLSLVIGLSGVVIALVLGVLIGLI